MFNKKIYVYILMLFLVSICAISTVSASENITDTVATDDANSGDLATSFNEDLNVVIEEDVVSSDNEEDVVSSDNEDDVESQDLLASQKDDDVLSAFSISSLNYDIDLNDDGYVISGTNGGIITFYMSPCQTYALNAYNFYFALFQVDENNDLTFIYKTNTVSSTVNRAIGNHNYKFQAKFVTPGTYILAAYNDGLDNKVMDTTILQVKGTAVISANNYNAFYNSGQSTTVKVTDKDTGKPLKYVQIRVDFNDGKKTVSGVFLTNSAGQITYVPPLDAGTYTTTYSSNFPQISAAAVKRTVVINKPTVNVTASKVSAYQGYKVTLKATVKSQGKNVNEGNVTFKINGKTYNVAVKNGVATKSIKFGKVKSYKYTATFTGKNFQKSAAASSTATIKKRSATKIIVSNIKVYRGDTKAFYVTVKTTSGKIVKSGKVKIVDTVKVNSKGKAKFYASLDLNYINQVGNTVYFKKTVTKTYTVKYTPSSKAYKPSTKKMKITMKYKCTACGSKTSHSHPSMNMRFIVS